MISPAGKQRDLPVLAQEDSAHAQGLRPRGVRQQLALALLAMWPSASWDGVGTPDSVITRLNSPVCTCRYRRFACTLTGTDARLAAIVVR